jgi:hypothetical protein
MIKKVFVLSVLSATFLAGWLGMSYLTPQVDFNTDVRPILNKNCLPCHGGVKQLGDLSFLFMDSAVNKISESGERIIVPGSARKSLFMKRILSADPEFRMPPEKDALAEQDVDILRKWIDQGAKYDAHWAYKPLNDEINIPEIKGTNARNALDHFIINKLKKQGLALSPEADKYTLIRRLCLDLTGLPPTISEINEFIQDSSENSYENLIDRQLSSRHFGEKWAAMWLDLARYADSKGYQKDKIRREIWRYRDWVIKAFNDDMPFDQFTIEQLAGDLLEDPTDNQILATAYHRNTMTNDEGGTDDEEYRVAAVIDRLNTTFEVWQGTTMSCVQCHSHPYDPIRQEEFYQLYSFFNNTKDADDNFDSPLKTLYSPAQNEQRAALGTKIESMKEKGDTLSDSYQALVTDFLAIIPGKVQIMAENAADSCRTTRVFIKGNWLSHGDTVHPKTPSFLPPMKAEYPTNRLGLAQWLVDGNNPLTSRVMVNRIWEQIFGNGLVATLSDFGTQGNIPSHQDLLDYLAVQFEGQHQWSIKSLLRQIVLSSTYRQSSVVSPDLLKKDPYNYLLARGARYRLSAEMIRDQALVISGLFNDKVYGPSVKPYQPEGVWNVIRHVDKWENGTSGDQYRRGIYTFWRRVSPYPSMVSFDAPSREVCVSQRIRTNTPLQALVTMNDPVYVEASEALARRMIDEGGTNGESQITYGYKLALMKEPDKRRLDELKKLYDSTLAKYHLNATDVGQEPVLENSNEFKTMSLVANVILNLDEVIMKT